MNHTKLSQADNYTNVLSVHLWKWLDIYFETFCAIDYFMKPEGKKRNMMQYLKFKTYHYKFCKENINLVRLLNFQECFLPVRGSGWQVKNYILVDVSVTAMCCLAIF